MRLWHKSVLSILDSEGRTKMGTAIAIHGTNGLGGGGGGGRRISGVRLFRIDQRLRKLLLPGARNHLSKIRNDGNITRLAELLITKLRLLETSRKNTLYSNGAY